MLRIATVQLNVTVGDIANNLVRISNSYHQAIADGAELVVFSEMTITGYPPEDLVLLPHFQQSVKEAVDHLAKLTTNDQAMLVGGVHHDGAHLYNAVFFLHQGCCQNIIYKQALPNYGVFDEKRLFKAGTTSTVVHFNHIALGILVCEDVWTTHISQALKQQGVQLLIALNASPFELNKRQARFDITRHVVTHNNLPLIYVNQIGGQDELVFDGGSFAMAPDGNLIFEQPYWQEHLHLSNWDHREGSVHCVDTHPLTQAMTSQEETIYEALTLGLRDYVHKNHFPGVIIGMSGGIDSALSAAIAVDALGVDQVRLILMPSIFTSKQSSKDARDCAAKLGVPLESMPINPMVKSTRKILKPFFRHTKPDTAEENIQSRIRGLLLMAMSNKFGHMVLTTGNKSEMAVGYATLYGDMCGGFNVLKDLYKTQVYDVARWRNMQSFVIPESILTKAPTAELKTNQTDQDSLPEYEILDSILYHLLEERLSSKAIIQKTGYEPAIVGHVAQLVQRAEYKRRQAPPGVKITTLAFGRDRRYPITSRFGL